MLLRLAASVGTKKTFVHYLLIISHYLFVVHLPMRLGNTLTRSMRGNL